MASLSDWIGKREHKSIGSAHCWCGVWPPPWAWRHRKRAMRCRTCGIDAASSPNYWQRTWGATATRLGRIYAACRRAQLRAGGRLV